MTKQALEDYYERICNLRDCLEKEYTVKAKEMKHELLSQCNIKEGQPVTLDGEYIGRFSDIDIFCGLYVIEVYDDIDGKTHYNSISTPDLSNLAIANQIGEAV